MLCSAIDEQGERFIPEYVSRTLIRGAIEICKLLGKLDSGFIMLTSWALTLLYSMQGSHASCLYSCYAENVTKETCGRVWTWSAFFLSGQGRAKIEVCGDIQDQFLVLRSRWWAHWWAQSTQALVAWSRYWQWRACEDIGMCWNWQRQASLKFSYHIAHRTLSFLSAFWLWCSNNQVLERKFSRQLLLRLTLFQHFLHLAE